MADHATIVIGGDLCPIGRVAPVLARGDAEAVFGEYLPCLQAADLFAANLECPLVTERSPAVKGGPVLEASPECLAGLKRANLGLVSLANNHAMDHGPAGLASTLAACRAAGIDTAGAGANLAEAGALWSRNVRGCRLGILAVAESEYSIAGPGWPGANPMDPIRMARALKRAKSGCDFLIALVHGGNEHLPIPRPGLRDYCRWLAEEGVRVVICQHSHCLGTFERHCDGLIVYGQGNLLFDWGRRNSAWCEGALVKLRIARDSGFDHELLPYRLKPDGAGIVPLTGSSADAVLEAFRERSEVLNSDGAYEANWRRFCETQRWTYMSLIHGFSLPAYLLNRTGILTRSLYTRSQLRNIGNLVRCESHREVLTTLAHLDLAAEIARHAAVSHEHPT